MISHISDWTAVAAQMIANFRESEIWSGEGHSNRLDGGVVLALGAVQPHYAVWLLRPLMP